MLILFGQVMFKNDNDYEKELIVNNKDITDSTIKLFNDALSNKINENDFFSKLINLSKAINFFYEVSKLYTKIFLIESEYHEVFTSLIFKKKYQNDKNDYVNSISILISGVNIDKFKYEELLNYINKNYNNEKDFIKEYITLFLNDKINYSDKINEKIKISPKDNKLELKRIINNKKKDFNKTNSSNTKDKSKVNNNIRDNNNLINDSNNKNPDKNVKSNIEDNKNLVENININNYNPNYNSNLKKVKVLIKFKNQKISSKMLITKIPFKMKKILIQWMKFRRK